MVQMNPPEELKIHGNLRKIERTVHGKTRAGIAKNMLVQSFKDKVVEHGDYDSGNGSRGGPGTEEKDQSEASKKGADTAEDDKARDVPE